MKRFRFILWNLAALFILTAACEVGLRLFFYHTLGPEAYRLRMLVTNEIHGVALGNPNYNNLGFGSYHDYFIKKPSTGHYRILVLGGSGAGGNHDENWPTMLMDLLNEDSPDTYYEVINGGTAGATSSRELYLLSRWIHLDPDLVIVYDGWNDLYNSHYSHAAYLDFDEGRKDAVYSLESRIKFFLNRHSEIFREITRFKHERKRRVSERRRAEQPAVAPVTAAVPDDRNILSLNRENSLYVRNDLHGTETYYAIDLDSPIENNLKGTYDVNLESMAVMCQRRGIPILFVTQPSLTHHRLQYQLELDTSGILDMTLYKHQDWQRTVGALYHELVKMAREVSHRTKAHYADFTHVFGLMQDPRKYFTDDVHQTRLGKKVIARSLKRFLIQAELINHKPNRVERPMIVKRRRAGVRLMMFAPPYTL